MMHKAQTVIGFAIAHPNFQPFLEDESATSRALPWFESYADQDRTIRMFLRNAGNEEAMMAPDMIGFMESVV
jgi:acyl-CoA hydrolase